MTTAALIDEIMAEEGFEPTAYPDPLSGGAPWTIGYGHTGRDVHPGLTITPAHGFALLQGDLYMTKTGLTSAITWWQGLDPVRQDVLADMAFELGVHGLLEFAHALAAAHAGEFDIAAAQMLDSAWARQVPGRAERLAGMMRTGARAPSPANV